MDTDKEQKRKERLAKWKAAQAAKQAQASKDADPLKPAAKPAAKPVTKPIEKPAAKSIAKPIAKPKKRSRIVFDQESEETPRRKNNFIEASFHTADNDTKEDAPQIDSLDAFMSNLEDGAIEQGLELEVASDEENVSMEAEVDPEDPRAYMEALNKKQRKTIPEVDHATMNYLIFRKQFYVPDGEPQDFESSRAELGLVVKDSDIGPIQNWSQAGLSQPLMEIIDEHNFQSPTPIQAQALPIIMNGRDVVSVAQTGSGKTIAYLLPLFRHVIDQPHSNGEGPIAIVLSPTRELCIQIHAEMGPFLKKLNLSAVCAYGGSPVKEQIDQLKRGSPIVVATPGRMIDLLAANNGRVTNLSRTTLVVIDEADRMFDMGFEPQVKRIIDNVRPDRQTVLFSATFSKPMERQALPFLTDPAHIQVGLRSRVSSDVEQHVEILPLDNKSHKLLQILGQLFQEETGTAQAVVFVEKQDHADELANWLASKGYDCVSLHGGREQSMRDATIKSFKLGKLALLVATSVAARGLDIKNLKLVVNYDPPSHLEDYVHRVGRTGRAGEKGVAVTFLSPDQISRAHDVVRALKMSHQPVPEELQKMDDEFNASVKKGTVKVHGGFGGKGLERLESKRETQRALERETHPPEARDSEETPQTASRDPTPLPAGTVLPGPAPGVKGPGSAKFHAMLEINDFPQAARLAVTSYGNQNKVIEDFGVSITAQGQFVPAGQDSTNKLKLAVEGNDEVSVAGALQTLSTLLREGITQASKAGGRYKVQ